MTIYCEEFKKFVEEERKREMKTKISTTCSFIVVDSYKVISRKNVYFTKDVIRIEFPNLKGMY